MANGVGKHGGRLQAGIQEDPDAHFRQGGGGQLRKIPAVNAAVAKAGGTSKYVTTIVLGKKVKKISKSAFKNYKQAKTLVVKSKRLKKAGVKKSLKGSKITRVKVKVGSKKINKKYVKKYKKIFTKKIVGKKVKVSR